ncbi:MAG: hypothetical protein ACLTW9_02035 [Enterocloster sp.]
MRVVVSKIQRIQQEASHYKDVLHIMGGYPSGLAVIINGRTGHDHASPVDLFLNQISTLASGRFIQQLRVEISRDQVTDTTGGGL